MVYCTNPAARHNFIMSRSNYHFSLYKLLRLSRTFASCLRGDIKGFLDDSSHWQGSVVKAEKR